MKSNLQSGRSGLLIVAIVGLSIATLTFLIAFITTQRAKTIHPRYRNLRIPPITTPTRPTIEPFSLPKPTIVPTLPNPTPVSEEVLNPFESPSGSPVPSVEQ